MWLNDAFQYVSHFMFKTVDYHVSIQKKTWKIWLTDAF